VRLFEEEPNRPRSSAFKASACGPWWSALCRLFSATFSKPGRQPAAPISAAPSAHKLSTLALPFLPFGSASERCTGSCAARCAEAAVGHHAQAGIRKLKAGFAKVFAECIYTTAGTISIGLLKPPSHISPLGSFCTRRGPARRDAGAAGREEQFEHCPRHEVSGHAHAPSSVPVLAGLRATSRAPVVTPADTILGERVRSALGRGLPASIGTVGVTTLDAIIDTLPHGSTATLSCTGAVMPAPSVEPMWWVRLVVSALFPLVFPEFPLPPSLGRAEAPTVARSNRIEQNPD
jgi:hypothetical protein